MLTPEKENNKKDEKKDYTGIIGKSDYNTDFDDIESLLSELSKPKQSFQAKTEPEPEPEQNKPENEDIYDPAKNDIKEPKSPAENLHTGMIAAEVLDILLSFAAAQIADTGNREEFSATPEEKNKIGEAIAEYTKDKPIDLPPWLTLLLIVVTTYLPRFSTAFKIKKLAEHDSRIEDLEKKINDLKKDEQNNNDKK